VTAFCSTVQVVTPYDNIGTNLHEGTSGKNEILEQAHPEEFFRRRSLKKFCERGVVPLASQTIDCCLDGSGIEVDSALTPVEPGQGA
jgi:hypothetical protein